jgi:hypothetical protein
MNVIGFLYVSLGGSTVQLHDKSVTGLLKLEKTRFVHVHRRVSVVKMATVLECPTEEQRTVCIFLWAKELNAIYIHNKIFPVYGGKFLSLKAIRNWVQKLSEGFSKVAKSVGMRVDWN